MISGVLDLTTTELADELVGGVFSAGPDRLLAAGRSGIPQVVSFGALDMVNFGSMETVPGQFKDRTLHIHNASVTLMRTTPEENTGIGQRIAQRLVPVFAGVCGTDPFRSMPRFVRQLQEIGFSGVQNFPTVGLIDGVFRQNLEETGMSYDLEVEMIRDAHSIDLATSPYVFDESQAEKMADAGADIVVAHMGLTTSGTIGARTALSLEESVDRVQRIADAAHSVRADVVVLCHGGPIAYAADAEYVLTKTQGVAGFFGASSVERLPTETAIADAVADLKRINVGRV
jgi:predicted TIM-barrel enzyme